MAKKELFSLLRVWCWLPFIYIVAYQLKLVQLTPKFWPNKWTWSGANEEGPKESWEMSYRVMWYLPLIAIAGHAHTVSRLP